MIYHYYLSLCVVVQMFVCAKMASPVGIYSRGIPNAFMLDDGLNDDEQHFTVDDRTKDEGNIVQLDLRDDAPDIERQREILREMNVYIYEKPHKATTKN